MTVSSRLSEAVTHKTCVLCGHTAGKVLHATHRYFYHCQNCDIVFVPAEWHLTETAQRERYRQHENTLENKGYVDMLGEAVTLLRTHAPEARRVLDYGAGPEPVLVELLSRRGYDASGYDLVFRPNEDLSQPFDAVVSVETFEHFADPRTEIERVVGLLRPDGCLVVMTLLHQGPASLDGWWYIRDQTHVCFYSRRTLDWIGHHHDLELLHCDDRRLAMFRRA